MRDYGDPVEHLQRVVKERDDALKKVTEAESRAEKAEKERDAFHTTCGELLQAAIEADGTITWSKLECKNCADVEKDAEKQRQKTSTAIHVAVTESCTCGGRGPTDSDVCPACMVWHRANDALQKKGTEKP